MVVGKMVQFLQVL